MSDQRVSLVDFGLISFSDALPDDSAIFNIVPAINAVSLFLTAKSGFDGSNGVRAIVHMGFDSDNMIACGSSWVGSQLAPSAQLNNNDVQYYVNLGITGGILPTPPLVQLKFSTLTGTAPRQMRAYLVAG